MTVREASSTAHALKQGKAWKLALVLSYLTDVAASSRQLHYRLNEVENKRNNDIRDLAPEYDECCKSQFKNKICIRSISIASFEPLSQILYY